MQRTAPEKYKLANTVHTLTATGGQLTQAAMWSSLHKRKGIEKFSSSNNQEDSRVIWNVAVMQTKEWWKGQGWRGQTLASGVGVEHAAKSAIRMWQYILITLIKRLINGY